METIHTDKNRSIVRNVAYGFSTWVLPLGLSFVATPYIVRALGHEEYGIYALVLGFIGYSFNFSIGRAITKYVAEYRASGETEKISRIVSATLFLNVAVGLAGLFSVLLLAGPLVRDVFRIEPASQQKTVYALSLAGLIIFFLMLGQVFSAVIQGVHRFDVYSKVANFTSFSMLGGNLALAVSGYGLIPLLLWNLLVTVVSCAVYAFAARNLLPEMSFRSGFGRESFRLVVRYSSGVIGYQVVANILLLTERSWITRELGAESLTFYVVPMTLGLYLHGFISSLTMVVFPLASEMAADRERLLRLYTKALKIVCFLTVFMAVTLIVENRAFLTLWMGPEFAERSGDLLVLHTIAFAVAAVSIVTYQTAEGLGHPAINFATIGACLALFLPLMVWLTPAFGNYGVAQARTAAFSLWLVTMLYVEKRFFGAVQVRFWLRVVVTLGIAGAAAGAAERMVMGYLDTGWIPFVAAVGLGGVSYLAVVWASGYVSGEEKEMFRRLVRS